MMRIVEICLFRECAVIIIYLHLLIVKLHLEHFKINKYRVVVVKFFIFDVT